MIVKNNYYWVTDTSKSSQPVAGEGQGPSFLANGDIAVLQRGLVARVFLRVDEFLQRKVLTEFCVFHDRCVLKVNK